MHDMVQSNVTMPATDSSVNLCNVLTVSLPCISFRFAKKITRQQAEAMLQDMPQGYFVSCRGWDCCGCADVIYSRSSPSFIHVVFLPPYIFFIDCMGTP